MSLIHTIINQLNEAKKDYPDWMKNHPDWIAKV